MSPTTTPSESAAPAVSFALGGGLSAALVAGLAMASAVEAVALHLWLAPRHPVAAWAIVGLTVLSVAWLELERRGAARHCVVVGGGVLELRAGSRGAARIPLGDVAGAERLTWRTQPAPALDYLNAAKPAEPNVLLTLRRPTEVRVSLGVTRAVTRIGLAVHDDERFVACVAGGA